MLGEDASKSLALSKAIPEGNSLVEDKQLRLGYRHTIRTDGKRQGMDKHQQDDDTETQHCVDHDHHDFDHNGHHGDDHDSNNADNENDDDDHYKIRDS